MINNAGGGPGRFDAVCIVTKKDGSTGIAYVVGEGKGGKQGHRLSSRKDEDSGGYVEQGTKEYFRSVLLCMDRRGGKEAALADQLAEANKEGRVDYVHVHGRLDNTSDGQIFTYTAKFFDFSQQERNQ